MKRTPHETDNLAIATRYVHALGDGNRRRRSHSWTAPRHLRGAPQPRLARRHPARPRDHGRQRPAWQGAHGRAAVRREARDRRGGPRRPRGRVDRDARRAARRAGRQVRDRRPLGDGHRARRGADTSRSETTTASRRGERQSPPMPLPARGDRAPTSGPLRVREAQPLHDDRRGLQVQRFGQEVRRRRRDGPRAQVRRLPGRRAQESSAATRRSASAARSSRRATSSTPRSLPPTTRTAASTGARSSARRLRGEARPEGRGELRDGRRTASDLMRAARSSACTATARAARSSSRSAPGSGGS